jgi:hypothetical protein
MTTQYHILRGAFRNNRRVSVVPKERISQPMICLHETQPIMDLKMGGMLLHWSTPFCSCCNEWVR